MENLPVARKVNAGFELACREGADHVTFVGSDDWMHADLFQPLVDSDECRNSVLSGREITLVDLSRNVLTRMQPASRHGVIPWIIPAAWVPAIPDHWNSGLDYGIYKSIRTAPWTFHDPHSHCRVDFKSDNNITPWSRIGRSIGNSPEAPLDELRQWYPAELVDLAEELA